jgi:hypothetical protein
MKIPKLLRGTTRRLHGKKWPVIAGIILVIVLIILTLITVTVNSFSSSKANTTVTIDGTNVTTYKKASKAEKKVATTVEGIATLEFNTNAEIISVEVQSGSSSWSADSDNILSNIVGLVSDPAIVHSNDMVFTLNANACTDGDTVIVTVKSYSSASKWKKVLDKGVSTTYFAFTAVHKEVETAVEETAEGETTVAAPVLPSGTMVFDGVTYETYSTEDEALDHVIGLPSSITSGCTLTGVPGENTTRMHAWIDYIDEGYLPGLEVFLYSDKNWTESLDLSGLAGRTIVFAFASETGDLIPKVTYEYVAFKLPQHISE